MQYHVKPVPSKCAACYVRLSVSQAAGEQASTSAARQPLQPRLRVCNACMSTVTVLPGPPDASDASDASDSSDSSDSSGRRAAKRLGAGTDGEGRRAAKRRET
jgi:hypothetical protein